MENWPKWIKYTIVWTFYIAAVISFFGLGWTKILGIPFGVAGYALQKGFKISID